MSSFLGDAAEVDLVIPLSGGTLAQSVGDGAVCWHLSLIPFMISSLSLVHKCLMCASIMVYVRVLNLILYVVRCVFSAHACAQVNIASYV